MQEKISRRKLAHYLADQVVDGNIPDKAVAELAAYLVETKRIRELDLVVRALEDELAARGIVIARVTTAHPLSDALRREVKGYVDAPHVYVEEILDPQVLGGVRIETPGRSLDATMKRKLLALSQAKM